jgi:hypothetical protein
MRRRRQQPRAVDFDDEPIQPNTDRAEPDVDWADDSDLDDSYLRAGDGDDERWDAFIADDDERDPLPEPGDFPNDEFPNDE